MSIIIAFGNRLRRHPPSVDAVLDSILTHKPVGTSPKSNPEGITRISEGNPYATLLGVVPPGILRFANLGVASCGRLNKEAAPRTVGASLLAASETLQVSRHILRQTELTVDNTNMKK
jgi:hypothetical protein